MSRPLDWQPLRAADPAPGDADAVRNLARRWSDTASAVETATAGLRAVHGSTTTWRSASGRAFAAQAAHLAEALDRTWWRYAAGAQVLRDHARSLDDAQEQADAALRRGQRAHDDLLAAERVRRSALTARTLEAAATGTTTQPDAAERSAQARADDAQRRLSWAERDLQEAEQHWRSAAARTCAELDALADDGLTDRLDGVLDVLKTATTAVSWVSAGLGLTGTAVAPVLPPVGLFLGTAGLATGAVAMTGTTALWLTDRATGHDVAWAAVGPAAGGAAKALRLLDELPRPGAGPRPAGPPASGSVLPPPAATPARARPRRAERTAEGVSTGSDVRTVAGGVAASSADEQPRR